MFSKHPLRVTSHLVPVFAILMLPATLEAASQKNLTLQNPSISREISTADDVLSTRAVTNRITGQRIAGSGDEFQITYTPENGRAETATARDFKVTSVSKAGESHEIRVSLDGKRAPLSVVVRYWIQGNEPWMHKQLAITAKQSLTIGGVAVEALEAEGACEPYKADQFTAKGASQWRPPLGQPVYTSPSASWWGVEFPAARNTVSNENLRCIYLTDKSLGKGETYTTHSAACGVADDSAFLRDAFFEYMDATRARPLRLQTQYNSWFDYGPGVDAGKFIASVKKVNEELVVDRGVSPLKAYVIDDGWQDTAADWTKTGVWPVNGKFDKDFENSFAAVKEACSELGLWLSPGCLFGAQKAIPKMKAAGWKTLDPWMSLTGDDYMTALGKRMVELSGAGVNYFKLDGVFGHLNQRNFDIPGFKGGEPELNAKSHDAAKERYLSLGSERLIDIFHRMAEVNPDVYIVISNGAFLSPWWLQHVDTVWMINAGDAAGGADRTGELVYRDSRYHQLAAADRDNTQYPLNSLFNHEPKKTSTGESEDVFRRYLYMSLSRGTGFVELYLKTFKLSEPDWDVLAEGMKWVETVFPAFKRGRMHGGDPANGEVYGYTGWMGDQGYVSFHNPSDTPKTCTVTLDRAFGLPKDAVSKIYQTSSPLAGDTDGLPPAIRAGKTLTIQLPARAIRILEFRSHG